MPELTIEQYTEKSIVVRGNTQPYLDKLKELGGKWNNALKGGAGWIFHISKKSIIDDLNNQIDSGSVKSVPYEKKTYEKKEHTSSSSVSEKEFVPLKSYLDLLARVERLEAIVSQVDFVKGSTRKESGAAVIEIASSDNEDEEPEKVERLLKRKPIKK